MTLILKVLCDQCGDKIGEVHRDGADLHYRPVWQNGRGVARPTAADSITTPRFWCVSHGWTDPKMIAAAVSGLSRDRVATHRAAVSPRHL